MNTGRLGYSMLVSLSPRQLLLNREILLLAKSMVLWQGNSWARNYGQFSPEILQRN